jgi:YVTN family beta-propeller protein
MKTYLLQFAFFTLLIATSCDSTNSNSSNSLKGVYVLNEGNFGQANASITVYNTEARQAVQNIYENQNGTPIGDVLYSATEIGDRLYLVVNNSNKIVVVDKESFTMISTITIEDQASPRELIEINENKAYVTNLFGNSVSVIDLIENEEVSTIPVGSNPEGIAQVGNFAYVANSGFGNGNTVSVIDTDLDEVIRTLTVGDNPVSIVKRDNDILWIVCVGAYGDFSNPDDDTPGTIYVINGTTGDIVTNFEVGGHPGDLVLNERDDIAYLINGSVMT